MVFVKPIKLVMNAFGPYKDRVEIDFEKLGNNGIFLITGDTGSGKTTIYDAISFALFGVSSGSRRENSSLRSDFASDKDKTYVELVFSHKGIIYKIERVPRYTRQKVRGSGTTSVGGDATLSYLDEIITGDKNVSDKCIEVLGINSNQFKQIVMIAQGEFMELLHSKPRDRAVIFRKIFDTGIYKDISDKLKDIYLFKRREYEDNILTLGSYKNNIIWDREIDCDISIVLLLELLDEYNIKIKLEEEQLNFEKSELDKEYELVVKSINEGILINDSFLSLQKLEQDLDELINDKIIYDEKESILQKNRDIFLYVISKKNEVIKIKERLDSKKNEYMDIISINDQIEKRYKEVELEYKEISELENKLLSLNNEKRIYDNKLIVWNEFQELKTKFDEKNNILNLMNLAEKEEIIDKFKILEEFNSNLKEKEKEYKELSFKYRESNNNYVKAYEEFLNGQAGIIASNLKDNCPCPVCGSLEHPNIAIINSSVLTKEDIDRLKNEFEVLSKNLEDLALIIGDIKKDIIVYNKYLKNYNYDELNEQIKVIKKNIVDFDVDITIYDKVSLEREVVGIYSLISEKDKLVRGVSDIESISSEIDKLSSEIDDVNYRIKKINSIYQEVSVKKERYNTLIDTLKKELDKLKDEYSRCNDEYMLSYKKLGYEKEEDYLSIVVDDSTLTKLENDVSEYKIKLVEINSGIKSLEKFLKDKKQINVVELQSQKEILEDKIKDKDVALKELDRKLFNNLSIYNSIKNVYDKLIVLENEVMMYKDLSDTANGNISGKNKLEFEQYVQANYFDMVIVSANKRFSYMTDERYLLVRKDEALKVSDKLGLELEIIDNYTGKRRDVKTLSGGESFKAALSLALGMSDVIQEFAGGIVVDAMFIDEGFGSLDDTSLEQAMNAIMMLSQNDKIIGIISHVNELKSRIDKKIIVRKSNCGSSVEICG